MAIYEKVREFIITNLSPSGGRWDCPRCRKREALALFGNWLSMPLFILTWIEWNITFFFPILLILITLMAWDKRLAQHEIEEHGDEL